MLVFSWNPQAFVDFLPYLGRGMAGVLVVILVIVLLTTLLNHLFQPKPPKDGES